jgi:hypothetical protein
MLFQKRVAYIKLDIYVFISSEKNLITYLNLKIDLRICSFSAEVKQKKNDQM